MINQLIYSEDIEAMFNHLVYSVDIGAIINQLNYFGDTRVVFNQLIKPIWRDRSCGSLINLSTLEISEHCSID